MNQEAIHYTRLTEKLLDLLYAGHHSNAGRNVLLSLGNGDDSLGTQSGHIVTFNFQDLVPGLQPCQVGTAAVLHRQDVTGSVAPKLEAKVVRPTLVGRRHAEDWWGGEDGRNKIGDTGSLFSLLGKRGEKETLTHCGHDI